MRGVDFNTLLNETDHNYDEVNMFQENEHVVYGRMGVCLVEGIEHDAEQDYYCLRSLDQNCWIKTPVNGTVPIRKVMSREEAQALIDRIPSIPEETLKGLSTRDLYEQCKALVSSQNGEKLIALTMALYSKKRKAQRNKKKLSSTEDAFLKEGEGLLFSELAVALGIPYSEVQGYIRKRVQAQKQLDFEE